MIKESKDLASMLMEALFGKFLEYEHGLIRQSHVEDTKKKRKGIELKVSSTKEDHKESSSDDKDVENLSLMVKNFDKVLKRSNEKKFSKPLNQIVGSKATSNQIVLSTLKNNLLKRKERNIENHKRPT